MDTTRWYLLTLASFISLALTPRAETPSHDENAALQYYQAFLSMPGEQKLSDKEKDVLDNWHTAPLDKSVADLLDKYRESFRFLQYGVKCKQCRWGHEMIIKDVGLGAKHASLDNVYRLAKATCLRARYNFSKGELQKGLDNLLAVMIFARHVGSEGADAAKLYEDVLELWAIKFTASQLPKITDKKLLRPFQERLDQLPPSGPLGSAILIDNQMMITFVRKTGIKGAESLLPAFNMKNVSEDEKKAYRALLGWKEEDIPRLCQAIEKTWGEAAKLADLPLDRCEAEEKALRKKLEMEKERIHPFGIYVFLKVNFPPVANLRFSQARMEVFRSMFRVAIATTLDGPDSIKRVKDPYGNGPFTYRKLEKGFELSSVLKEKNGKPMALIVGPSN